MDVQTFATMIADPRIVDLKKLKHKYKTEDMGEFMSLLKQFAFHNWSLQDGSCKVVHIDSLVKTQAASIKSLMKPGNTGGYAVVAAMEETESSFQIEDIDFTRESVRKIFQGNAPDNLMEERILGMKRGLEFIANPDNQIDETNLRALYRMAIVPSLDEKNALQQGAMYRHDTVYVVENQKVIHAGISHERLDDAMQTFIAFIREEGKEDELLKSAVIHFWLSYLHPYFDGNGRMSRLLQLWYLIQKGYTATLQVLLRSEIPVPSLKIL